LGVFLADQITQNVLDLTLFFLIFNL